MRTTVFLLVCLMLALAIVLGNRRIGVSQPEWWAAETIALLLFIVGRYL